MLSLKPVFAVVTAAIVLAGGSLAISVVDLLGPAEDDALELVPADAAIYTNVFLDPSASQKLALDDLLAHFPEATDRDAARDRIVELLDKGLAEVGLSFDADIDPWLGDQLAFFMQAPTNFTAAPGAAVLLETDDIDAALATVDKAQAADATRSFTQARYEGVDYEVDQEGNAVAAVDSFLVSGTEAGIKAAIDASQGKSLAASDRFDEALQGLAADRIALAYMDPAAFSRLAVGFPGGGGVGPGFGGAFNPANQGAIAFVAYARGDAVVIEGSSRLPEDPALATTIRGAARESKMLERLPGDAWLAIGVPDLGTTIRSLLRSFEQAFAQPQPGAFPGLPPGGLLGGFEAAVGLDLEADLLSWMGDAAFFVSGTDPEKVGGGAVIEATDERAARAALERLEDTAARFDAPVRDLAWKVGHGFSLQAPDMPESFNVLAADTRVLAIYGEVPTLSALGSDLSLAGTATFKAARASLGDGYALGGFVDLGAVMDLLEGAGLTSGPYAQGIETWTEPLSFVSFGTKIEGDSTLQRIVLGVR